MYNELLEANRRAIFEKLDALPRNKLGYIRCNDLIEALSESKERDKRLINDYTDDEVKVMWVNVNEIARECRCFTTPGVSRYIHEGRIYSYANVCAYFGVKPIDKRDGQIKKCAIDAETFDVKKILRWLFGKRKSIKVLGDAITTPDLLEWLTSYTEDDIDENNRQYLQSYLAKVA